MFALPEKDRQAFFSILDEYFSQRPHLLIENSYTTAETVANTPVVTKKAAPPPPPRQRQHAEAASPPSYYPPKDQSLTSAVNDMHVSSLHKEIRRPEGLTSGKVRALSI